MSDVDILHCIRFVNFCNRDLCSCNITLYFAKEIRWQQMRIICCKLKHTSSVMHVKLVTRWEEETFVFSVVDIHLSYYDGLLGGGGSPPPPRVL